MHYETWQRIMFVAGSLVAGNLRYSWELSRQGLKMAGLGIKKNVAVVAMFEVGYLRWH